MQVKTRHRILILWGFGLLYALDEPINTFPSMHVSFAFLSYYLMKKFQPRLQNVFLSLAIATTVSTFFVKQHYILDAVSAVVLAYLIQVFYIAKSA